MTRETITLEEQREFVPLTGDSIMATVQEVVITEQETVEATLTLSWDDWRRVADAGMFHLDNMETPRSFEAELPVEMRVQLRSAFADEVSDDADTLTTRLADPDDPLRSTDAWYCTRVSQELNLPDDLDEDAFASLGTETRWADWEPETEQTQSIRETVTGYLDAEGWEYEVTEDEALFVRFPVTVDGQEWSVVVQIDELDRSCLVYSFHPDPIPTGSYAEVCLRLNEANFDLEQGAFELDPGDGIVDFRTRVLPDQEPFGDALHAHLRVAADQFDTIDTLAGDTAGTGPAESSEPVSDLDDAGSGTDPSA